MALLTFASTNNKWSIYEQERVDGYQDGIGTDYSIFISDRRFDDMAIRVATIQELILTDRGDKKI
jgi:hypothetical protein